MAKRTRAYAPTVHDAAELLGAEVRDPTVALGTAFDVATLLGVPLFYERSRLGDEAARIRNRPVLLPRAVRARAGELDNEF
jgi:hypothetical protein